MQCIRALQASALETDKDLAKFEEEMARGSQVGRYTQFCGMPPRGSGACRLARVPCLSLRLRSYGATISLRRWLPLGGEVRAEVAKALTSPKLLD